MHEIEPFYRWRDDYTAADDDRSPLYGYINSQTSYTHQIYNYLIHPEWDNFGSETLYIKILYVNYDQNFAVIELMGEWNDCLHNDIMLLQKEIIAPMMHEGIQKFALIGENVLNFHASDDCYYEEIFDALESGWLVGLNFRNHIIDEFEAYNIHTYFQVQGVFDAFNWRKYLPKHLCAAIENAMQRRLGY
jgi:hypothetical protein